MVDPESHVLDRRSLLRVGAGALMTSAALPGVLAAAEAAQAAQAPRKGRAIVGDVLEFGLSSREWPGAFGFVKLRLHRGLVDGRDVYFIRTDASDRAFARRERLVFAPKLGALAVGGAAGAVYVVTNGVADQPPLLSSEPGRRNYTPAWRVNEVTWRSEPQRLASTDDVAAARRDGRLAVKRTDVIVNAPVVKWSTGELAVDRKLRAYLGDGQLIEPPDIDGMTVTFKLHQCFPGSRYIVTDHSIRPAAEMTKTAYAPRLDARPRRLGATGRTNVFMNGLKGPGPMGFQPSVFDSDPGDREWSPYWDHYTYAWRRPRAARVLRSERAIDAMRRQRALRRIPGVPDTKGRVFTVNCPVPVVAFAAFRG
jgi:hypothetical protein